jgi:hypothetical protein
MPFLGVEVATHTLLMGLDLTTIPNLAITMSETAFLLT